MRQRLRLAGFIALGALGLLLISVPLAWVLDMRGHDGEVARNVSLAGRPIGGLTGPQLTEAVDDLSGRFVEAPIKVTAPKGGFDTTTTALGVDVDKAATIKSALNAGRSGSVPGRIWSWLRGYQSDRATPVKISIDTSRVYSVVPEKDPGPREEPVEPKIKQEDDRFVAVDGISGTGIDPADVIAHLPDAARAGLPLTVEVDRDTIPPRYNKNDATALALRASSLTDRVIEVKAGDSTAKVPKDQLRTWVTAKAGPDELELGIDSDAAIPDLAKLLPEAGRPVVETTFAVDGGKVRVIPGRAGTKCCAPELADAIAAELKEPSVGSSPLQLPLAVAPPKMTAAEAGQLGIDEAVATFTTNHKPNQPRVKNIHRISDLVRGQVILPGKTFSVNDFIGRRTVAKGFVVDHVIEDGVFAEAVGGGVSQFATTTFNAAFFAGLGFGEYQSHSIYISRYPYGREATLSFPHPDLQIKNTTPYGVMIWPTYTGTSITITLYSTKHYEVTQTGQTSAPKGNCTRVKTARAIKNIVTGKVTNDSVFATYRPGEGVNC